MHYVNELEDGTYQSPRKTTGKVYEIRTPSRGVPIEKARVFTSRTAAVNSLNAAKLVGCTLQVHVSPNTTKDLEQRLILCRREVKRLQGVLDGISQESCTR